MGYVMLVLNASALTGSDHSCSQIGMNPVCEHVTVLHMDTCLHAFGSKSPGSGTLRAPAAPAPREAV